VSDLDIIHTTTSTSQVPVVEHALDREIEDEVDEYFEAGARVQPGDLIIDVGANVGAFAARVAERTAGQVTVHCFEPAPATFVELERTRDVHPWLSRARTTLHRVALTRSDLAGDVRPFYYFSRIPTNSTYDLADKHAEYAAYFLGKATVLGAWSAGRIPLVGRLIRALVLGLATLAFHRRNRLFVWVAERATGLEVLTCRTQSLELWAREHGVTHVDWLKIDVEGAEPDVLLGCGALWPSIRRVAVEAHERDGRVEAIERLLVSHGLSEIHRLRPRITEKTGLDNLILVAERPRGASDGTTEAPC